uniref:RNA recognition motif. (A.k.a. RRM, RBD, or RNP domain) n=1 Tax=Candidatus Kentrum sp. LFY TaxID=2126342 RepID=A0A450WRB7_9GAMM|nr:MAG: RNA recognition motif. (a.k.a. RRM, RBD, or RNP domain) [Candidatus Kentron sp. LFY]VFJ97838.1 MAG: RNA recognition motif. (a.k.a. RRM, RBD, or RNP domain) [Candidatus Kentron sp. LFY]VFK19548.1 MAG: RNA recognition motif. (a.k.a. RRM, RBD, or RNP domain) [Candidatus Kentron sp. LFY]
MNIYVGNLPYSMTEEELKEIFSEHGEVESTNVITDRFSGQSKGFGFVVMPKDDEANSAINALNETQMKGRPLRVNQAKPRPEKY